MSGIVDDVLAVLDPLVFLDPRLGLQDPKQQVNRTVIPMQKLLGLGLGAATSFLISATSFFSLFSFPLTSTVRIL